MMIAKNKYDWGFIEIKFAIEKTPKDNPTMMKIIAAHQTILETLAELEEEK